MVNNFLFPSVILSKQCCNLIDPILEAFNQNQLVVLVEYPLESETLNLDIKQIKEVNDFICFVEREMIHLLLLILN